MAAVAGAYGDMLGLGTTPGVTARVLPQCFGIPRAIRTPGLKRLRPKKARYTLHAAQRATRKTYIFRQKYRPVTF
jgi:hypothetical protein